MANLRTLGTDHDAIMTMYVFQSYHIMMEK